MSSSRRFVTIVVQQDGRVDSRTIRVPVWVVRAAAVVGSVIFGVLVLSIVLYGPIVRTAARVPGLTREVNRLRADNARVQQLAATLTEIEGRYDQMRTMLGGDIVPQRPRVSPAQPVVRSIIVSAPAGTRSPPVGPTIPTAWPLDERGIITRGTVQGGTDTEAHAGLDIAVPNGTPIRAAGGGVVAEAGEDPEYGFFVLIEHPEGYRSMYGHASRLLVAIGDTVRTGQVIALSGSTGRSTAPHLHFEVTHDGKPIDPRTIVSERN